MYFGLLAVITARLHDRIKEIRMPSLASQLKPVNAEIVFLNVFKGPLLPMYPLFVESIRRNPKYEWIFVHLGKLGKDVDPTAEINTAPNLQFVQTNADAFYAFANTRLNFTKRGAEVDVPGMSGYKFNDWKPLYGLLFRDEIRQCRWWAYADGDVVYGNISHFLTPRFLDKYDVVTTAEDMPRLVGSFSLFRIFGGYLCKCESAP
jgi:hypothetical protein